MKILKETERAVVDMECEWEDHELALILNYAHDNIPQDVLDSLLVSWAFEDIIRKQLDSMTSTEGDDNE